MLACRREASIIKPDGVVGTHGSGNWSKSSFTSGGCANFKAVIDAVISHFGLSGWGYKEVDQGLWVYAKLRF
jgi:hypothetical protein